MSRGAQYAITEDNVRIAFVTEGSGAPLFWIPHHFTSHVELEWDFPQCHVYRSLADRCMVVRLDTRGLGLSDREGLRDVSTQARVRDIDAVATKLGLERFALAGVQGGGNLAVSYAVQHPEKVSKLVLLNWAPNFSADADRARMASLRELLQRDWDMFSENVGGVSFGYNSPYAKGYGRLVRASLTQRMALRYGLALMGEDCTPMLPHIKAETLVLHSEQSAYASPNSARAASASIADCRLRVFAGELTEHIDRVIESIGGFVAPGAPAVAVSEMPTAASDARPQRHGVLTSREVEVLLLLSKGRSNREIAAELVLSPRTVERHLENLYRKTASRNRAEAAAYAAAQGIIPV